MSAIDFTTFYNAIHLYMDTALQQVKKDYDTKIPETAFLHKPLHFLDEASQNLSYMSVRIAFVDLGKRLFPRSKFFAEMRQKQKLIIFDSILSVYRNNGDLSLETRIEPPVEALKREFAEYAKRTFLPNIARVIHENMDPNRPAQQMLLPLEQGLMS